MASDRTRELTKELYDKCICTKAGDIWNEEAAVALLDAFERERRDKCFKDMYRFIENCRKDSTAIELPASRAHAGEGEGKAVSEQREWQPIETAPEGEPVMTKIDDELGVRNEQILTRQKRLWFFPDFSMYVYYAPTHWRQP